MCGVHFMAETAKLMNPAKTVLIPDLEAGCSLAASITAEDIRLLREQYPGVPVVTYVNTSAEVKAESDICCTSANALAGRGIARFRSGHFSAGRVSRPLRRQPDQERKSYSGKAIARFTRSSRPRTSGPTGSSSPAS